MNFGHVSVDYFSFVMASNILGFVACANNAYQYWLFPFITHSHTRCCQWRSFETWLCQIRFGYMWENVIIFPFPLIWARSYLYFSIRATKVKLPYGYVYSKRRRLCDTNDKNLNGQKLVQKKTTRMKRNKASNTISHFLKLIALRP